METIERIRETAKEKGIKLSYICQKLGLTSRTYFNDVEKNNREIPPERLDKIANILGVTADYLLGNTDQKEKPSSEDEGGDDCVVVFRNGQKITRHYDKEQLDLISNLLDQLDKNQRR